MNTDPDERGRIRENIAWAYAHGEITAEQAADALAALENEWSEMR